ncbi:spore germination protein KC [Metabacillus crassostreae]|uniref:Ger(x)C family spore germination protein n=1 Tax=Metabacillus crassostreae TaxID=929098 RepID=UPI00195AFFAE|nr:Ger(x)C family spore germination protein [Metabacillus crassostreae]MBM7604835.1 spore germination protein KC [Metabacillus crassostreae]
MKHSKIVFIIMFIAIIAFFVIGNTVESQLINKLAIVSAIGLDMEEEQYVISVQVVSPSSDQKGASEELGAVVYKEKGRTITEAFLKLNNSISRTLFFDDTDILILQDKLLETKGITDITDYLILNPLVSTNIEILVSKDVTANTILRTVTPVQKVSALRIKEILANNQLNAGTSFKMYPSNVHNDLLNKIKQTALPYITIQGDIEKGLKKENIEEYSPSTIFKLNGMAVFKEDKLIGFLDDKESRIYSMFQKKINRTLLTVTCPDEEDRFVGLNVTDLNSKITFEEAKKPLTFSVDVQVEGEIRESQCSKSVDYPNLEKIKKSYKDEMTKDIEQLISKSKEMNSDFIGFGKSIYLVKPRKWNELAKNWDQTYKESTIKINVDINIPLTGDSMSNVSP